MTAVNLPTGLGGLRASPKRQNDLRNLIYLREGRLVLRPCVSNILDSLDGSCRGMGIFRNDTTGDEELYGVFGSKLYRFIISDPLAGKDLNAGNITITEIGTIDNQNDCELVASFSFLVILTKGDKAYAYNQSSGLAEITDPLYKPSVSVQQDEGRFIFVPADGSPFFWSAQDDPLTYDAADFADGEQFPDPNKANFMRKGVHYVLGTRSVEASQYNPSIDSYLRLSENAARVGYVGGKIEYGENFAFLGQNSQGGFEFYEYSDFPQRISSDTVSEILNDEYFLNELDNITASHFIWKGTPILVFNLPRHTFAYYGDWAVWQTGITGGQQSTWRVNHVQYAYGYLWSGDGTDGILGNLVDESLEFGDQVEWLLSGFVVAEPQTNFPINYFYATMTEGFDSSARVAFSASKDGVIYGREHYKTLGDQGHYNSQVRWGGPIGQFPDTFNWRLRGYGSKLVNFDGVSYA